MRRLIRSASRIFAVLFAVAILLPGAGPIVDHHFAERQAGHLHLGTSVPLAHGHAYLSQLHHRALPKDRSDKPVAIYRYDGAIAAITAETKADAALTAVLFFEPSSIFLLPKTVQRGVMQHYEAPPGHPPPSLI